MNRKEMIFLTQGETEEEGDTPDAMVRSVSFTQPLSIGNKMVATSSVIESSLQQKR